MRIPALEATAIANGRSLTGRFPPLSRFGIKSDPGYSLEVTASATHLSCDGAADGLAGEMKLSPDSCVRSYPVHFFNNAPAEASTYNLSASASGIMADAAGRGRLNVSVRRSETDAPASTTLYLSVEGAELGEVRPVSGLTIASEPKGWRVTSTGEGTLVLENLIPNTAVKVNLSDGGRPASTISRGVVALPPPPQR